MYLELGLRGGLVLSALAKYSKYLATLIIDLNSWRADSRVLRSAAEGNKESTL